METWAFEPLYVPGAQGAVTGTLSPSVTVTGTTSSVASGLLSGNQLQNDKCELQISNTTNQWAYVNFGTYPNVIAATVASGYPVQPNWSIIVRLNQYVSQVSVILAGAPSGSASVTFTRGTGI